MSDLVGLSRHQGKATAARDRKEGPVAAAAAWPPGRARGLKGPPAKAAGQPARPASTATACCLFEP